MAAAAETVHIAAVLCTRRQVGGRLACIWRREVRAHSPWKNRKNHVKTCKVYKGSVHTERLAG